MGRPLDSTAPGRAPRARRPGSLGAAAAAFGAALLLAAASGCGGASERGSARELDEPRSYGRVVVRSEVDPRHVTLGDPVVWTLTATVPRHCQPGALRLDPTPSSLELVPRGEATITPGPGSYVWSRRYDLRGFDLGGIPLPAAVLAVRVGGPGEPFADTLVFPADTLAVDSLTQASTGDLAPDRGPVDPGLRPIDYAVAAGIGLLVVGLVAAFILARRRGRARPAAPLVPAEPPEAPFGRALEALRREGASLTRGAFHDRLSDAIRRYVAATTGVDAIDLTTRELEREMNRSGRTRPEAAAEVVRILRRSDLVKFAKRADAWEEAKGLIEDAARLAGAVAFAPPPGAAEEAPPGAGPPPAAPSPPAAARGGER